jgi:hypothetical protein
MSTYANEPVPPELAALMGGEPAAEPPPDTGASFTSGQKGDPSDLLRQAIMFIEAYMREEQDDEDLAAAASILKDVQSLLAAQQRLSDRATGAGPGARVVRRAAAQQRY